MQENIDFIKFSQEFFEASKVEFIDNVKLKGREKGAIQIDQKGKAFFDLTVFKKRYSLIGYNHPLELKSKFLKDEISQKCIENQIKTFFFEKQNFNIKLHNRIDLNKETFFPWSDTKHFSKQEALNTTGIFGISNHSKKQIVGLKEHFSSIFVHNFLPLSFEIYQDQPQRSGQDKITQKDITFSHLVLNYFTKGPFYLKDGRFNQVNTLLKKYFNDSIFKIHNLFVLIENSSPEAISALEEQGILCDSVDNSAVLSFPLSIHEMHIAKVHEIVIKCIKRDS
jgi:predicted oxidoreductase